MVPAGQEQPSQNSDVLTPGRRDEEGFQGNFRLFRDSQANRYPSPPKEEQKQNADAELNGQR